MDQKILYQKLLKVILFCALFTIISAKTFYPVWIWNEDERGYKCRLDDGTFRSTWKWLDVDNDGIASCYYFDQDGYLLSDKVAPDGNQVDDKGQWVVNGVVQQQAVSDEDRPKNEEEFRKLLDKKYAEFVANCDLAANEYINLLREDPDLYFETIEIQTKIIGPYQNVFRPLIETLCGYYGYSSDIGRTYINKADSYSYNKFKQVRDMIKD